MVADDRDAVPQAITGQRAVDGKLVALVEIVDLTGTGDQPQLLAAAIDQPDGGDTGVHQAASLFDDDGQGSIEVEVARHRGADALEADQPLLADPMPLDLAFQPGRDCQDATVGVGDNDLAGPAIDLHQRLIRYRRIGRRAQNVADGEEATNGVIETDLVSPPLDQPLD